jgi:hypothetical protein
MTRPRPITGAPNPTWATIMCFRWCIEPRMPARVLRSTGSGRRPVEDIHTSLTPLATAEANLVRLAEQAHRDLDALAHPAAAWVRPVAGPVGSPLPRS